MRRGGIVAATSLFVLMAACGSPKPPPPKAVATISSRCPDLAKADEVAAFDFATEYQLSRDAADKLKAAALAAMEIGLLADKLDAELGIACSQIAQDLANKGDLRSGNEACGAAIKAVHDARAKLSPKVTAALVVRVPVCSVDASLMTKCASICDSSVPAGRVKADCEQKAGRCDGNCDGICEAKTATKCDGTCSGTCDGPIKGTVRRSLPRHVRRQAVDRLRARASAWALATRARSTASARARAAGSCKLKAPGICDGLCAGTCSVELTRREVRR